MVMKAWSNHTIESYGGPLRIGLSPHANSSRRIYLPPPIVPLDLCQPNPVQVASLGVVAVSPNHNIFMIADIVA